MNNVVLFNIIMLNRFIYDIPFPLPDQIIYTNTRKTTIRKTKTQTMYKEKPDPPSEESQCLVANPFTQGCANTSFVFNR